MKESDIRKKYPYLVNSWRAFKTTQKGINIGFSEDWKSFSVFFEDMFPTYKEGLRLKRKDNKGIFSKENCYWEDKSKLSEHRKIKLEHNGEIKTLEEWSNIYDLNFTGVKLRYFRGKGFTSSQILFGKLYQGVKTQKPIDELNKQQIRSKASKMISSYRFNDKRKGLVCNLTIDFMIDNIFSKNCHYCKSKNNVGCDRKDNTKGHEVENVIPCCRDCNEIRGNKFTVEEMEKIANFINSEIKKK